MNTSRLFLLIAALLLATLPASAGPNLSVTAGAEADTLPPEDLLVAEPSNSQTDAQPAVAADVRLADTGSDHGGFLDAIHQAGMVFDGVLVEARVLQPEGARTLFTDYRFEVIEWFKGDTGRPEITLRSLGGERSDGTGLTTGESLKLSPNRRFLVVTKERPEEQALPFERVLQIFEGGSRVADEAGRVVVALKDGRLSVQSESEVVALSYLPGNGATQGSARPDVPPDNWQPTAAPVSEVKPLPMPAEHLFDRIASDFKVERFSYGVNSVSVELEEPTNQAKSQWCGGIREAQNYFTWIPNDDHWTYWTHCRGNWNTLVEANPDGSDWLIGNYTSNGQPIRDRLPTAVDGNNDGGVITGAQMVNGGYGTNWVTLGFNGINYTSFNNNNSCTEIIENDTFVNPAIANDPVQHRKSLVHEMGHALGQSTTAAGGHENRTYAIMFAGTFRQPPNYSSDWYARMDDMAGERAFLSASNASWPNSWVFEEWVDLATWSQTHDNWGSPGNLVMTNLSTYDAYRGDTVTVNRLQVENRGNLGATDVNLKFYLSSNTTISDSDYLAGTAIWASFPAHGKWSDGSWDIVVPNGIPAGDYSIGWILTLPEAERSTANNTTIMRRNSSSNFSTRTLTVLGQPDLIVSSASVDDSTPEPGQQITISATVENDGDGSSTAATLRYYVSNNATISGNDTQLGIDFMSSLAAGASSPESLTINAPENAGTYWVGACMDSVAHESNTSNQCSAGFQITVTGTPDLTTTLPGIDQISLAPGQQVNMWATARNIGSGSSESTTLRYYVSNNATISPADTELGLDFVPGLSPSGTSYESKVVTAPAALGTYWVGACVEGVNGESELLNNCSTGIQITVTGSPDLTVTSPGATPTVLTPSERFTVSGIVENIGNDSAAATTLRYFYSTDSIITVDDTEIGTDSVAGLAAGATVALSELVNGPPKAGSYFVGACVDEVNGESNGANQCSGGARITVVDTALFSDGFESGSAGAWSSMVN